MEILNDLEMPNKETLYFCDHIIKWISKEEWTDNKRDCVKITFKHDTPIDIINRFLICRPKLKINYSSHYLIADK